MAYRITLVRHGRSEANEANVWQGQGNAPLSGEGVSQAESLGRRLAGRSFDVVVGSDLIRASETARIAGFEVDSDPVWREMDLGQWEGRSFEQVAKEHPDLLEAIRSGAAIAFGGTGESIADFEHRAWDAFDGLVAEMNGEGSALVATHGGVIDAIVGRYLGRVPGRRTYPISTNTSLTVIAGDERRARLLVFNDATHLGLHVGFLGRMRDQGMPTVAFVRHGVTEANKEGRIQGQSCWGLAPEGVEQAARLADWYPEPGRVISSPLKRAMQTAAAFGLPVETDENLKEMGFGEWEGRLGRELAGQEGWRRIYREYQDIPRGGHGETFMQVVERMTGFLDRLDHRRDTIAVSHGAAIRALIAGFHGRGNDINRDLGVAPNTSVSHVVIAPEGPMLADYALAPHLGGSS